jgi:hypothetical protein
VVVADLTDLNANAFYELGIRHSTELPTIHIAAAGTILPFDNIAHRTIFVDLTDWFSTEQARKQLADSARAIKDPKFKVTNPITQANASFAMRESADPRDQVIAHVQERLESVESALRAMRPPLPSRRRSDVAAEFAIANFVERFASTDKDAGEGAVMSALIDFCVKNHFQPPDSLHFEENTIRLDFEDGTVRVPR